MCGFVPDANEHTFRHIYGNMKKVCHCPAFENCIHYPWDVQRSYVVVAKARLHSFLWAGALWYVAHCCPYILLVPEPIDNDDDKITVLRQSPNNAQAPKTFYAAHFQSQPKIF